jgi:hypothetical protein
MIGVEMGQEDVFQAHHARLGAHHLPLRALTAIEKDQIPLPVDQDS